MSEPKLISPMLDQFEMGGPISDHDGVCCCPAMRKNSDNKYIVKIISVPASQTKLEALLLTGAYASKSSALEYFKTLAEGIVEEKRILDELAQLEGFVPFEDCQIVPMEDATGYDVYLLSEYRKTLERSIAKKPLTQLAAVNLGLDLCSALSACRRSGYMFVDLKPSNIYVVGDREYRIGDLGFVRLNSLKYESLPDMYRSAYTAPEAEDAFSVLNDTMDIYSAGLILYQVFNGGKLPFSGNQAPNEIFSAPAFANEEMSAIILKACDPNPAERWTDPVQMGQAIVNYMQKNGVNDTPLTAEFFGQLDETVDEVPVDDTAEETLSEEFNDEISFDAVSESTENSNSAVSIPNEDVTQEVVSEISETISVEEIPIVVEPESENELPEKIEESTIASDLSDDSEIIADSPEDDGAIAEESSTLELELAEDAETIEEEYDNLSFLDSLDEMDLSADEDETPDGVSEILSQADELVAHQVPDPVIAPQPIEIKIPAPICDVDTTEDTNQAEDCDTEDGSVEEDEPDTATMPIESDVPEDEKPYAPKKRRKGLIWIIVVLILAGLTAGAYFFYTEYYLQPIHSLDLVGTEDKLQIQVSTDIDETLLTVVCADSHGNKLSSPVVGGEAAFSGLTPDTAYTVTVEVDGLHKLVGTTSKVYSTPIQTKIAQMSVVTGSESGSVILSFAVEGPDSDQWNVLYNAEGEAERVTTFPSHMVTLTGLTVGKEYSFRLEPLDDIYLSGNAETTYVVKNLICAENLHVAACTDGNLTVQWGTPYGESVSEWSVRCYSDAGFDETLVTAENTATFGNIDDSVAHTIEVTAADMSVNQRVQLSANSITVSDFNVDDSKATHLSLNWHANRDIPAEGWTIRYSVNGVNAATAVSSKKNSAKVPVVPNGNYVFTILDGNGNAVLGGPFTHTQKDASAFNAYGLKQSDITIRLCKTPASSSWSYKDLTDDDYVNTFSAGQKVSMVLSVPGEPIASDNDVTLTYVIYDENDNLVSYFHDSQVWQSMWYQNYCELDIAGVPAEVGTYKVVLLIDGAEVGSQKFAITV